MNLSLSDEQLKTIEELSGLFLSYEEIAIMIDVDYETFKRAARNKTSIVYKAYYKGRTVAKLEIRKNVVNLAKMGSPQAEILTDKYIADQKISENG